MAHQTSQVTGRPYSEKQEDGFVIREFSSKTSSFEFVWHRDKEDRYVQATHPTDWQFQLDNEYPQRLTKKKLFIPRETYHRLIKGTGDLKVKIYKLWIVIVILVTAKVLANAIAVIVNYEINRYHIRK
mgnify:CR=1 FL=1